MCENDFCKQVSLSTASAYGCSRKHTASARTKGIHAPKQHSLPLLAAAVGLGKEHNGRHSEDDERHRQGTNTGRAHLHQSGTSTFSEGS